MLALLLLCLTVSAGSAPGSEALAAPPMAPNPNPTPALGPWRAWLDSPGGELPFGIELERSDEGELVAHLVNGPERLRVPETRLEGERLVLSIDHYDSRIEATLDAEGRSLEGEWSKRSGRSTTSRLPFHARAGAAPRFGGSTATEAAAAFGSPGTPVTSGATSPLDGRWAVDFESDDLAAVAVFSTDADGQLLGTFLTATGDYRYLAGDCTEGRLRLSVFDGAHAFLFHARLREDGTLAGDFWSRDSWHETWTARRDDDARVPNAFRQTAWDERVTLSDVTVPDLLGRARSLAEPGLTGEVTIVQLFGSWCPNCHDETRYLVELDERYGDRGLRVIGLAFDLTGDFERDAGQVRVHARHHGADFPFFVAGTADKAAATLAFPAVDRLRSYPTTVFLDSLGHVRAVHSGFAGPATGDEHAALRREFEERIETLLTEGESGARRRRFEDETWSRLVAGGEWRTWFAPHENVRFAAEGDDRVAIVTSGQSVDARPRRSPARVSLDAVWVGDRLFQLEERTGLLLDPRDPGRRLRASDGQAPIEASTQDLGAPNPVQRREAIFALALERGPEGGLAEAVPLLDDPDAEVRVTAAWAVGHCGEASAVEPLIECLSHPHAALRREAARAIMRLPHRNGIAPDLLELLLDDPDPLVRAVVRDGLAFAPR